MVVVRTVLSIAASKGWIFYQLDVNNAFLQGDLYEEVYMVLPQEYDKYVGHNDDEELQDGGYQRLVVQLLYLAITRPDICFAVQVLSQFMQHPKQSHLPTALRVSKKQQTVSRSSAKVEYRSLVAVATKVTWLVGLLQELNIEIHQPVDLYCDSKATLQIAANPIFHEKTKHIEIDYHFVREKIKNGLLAPHHISTKLQLVDLMKKDLGVAQHSFLLSKLECSMLSTLQLERESWDIRVKVYIVKVYRVYKLV
uniref:Uncharacterized protein LOC104221105 n=1 Tax=Nicotiana sylvestris TaxID=4096 RepID=A0A1U7VR59_NICSY|nr:PREDICTED: uncharacterized protein LOC104221105 [Nicotiana sylvestris]